MRAGASWIAAAFIAASFLFQPHLLAQAIAAEPQTEAWQNWKRDRLLQGRMAYCVDETLAQSLPLKSTCKTLISYPCFENASDAEKAQDSELHLSCLRRERASFREILDALSGLRPEVVPDILSVEQDIIAECLAAPHTPFLTGERVLRAEDCAIDGILGAIEHIAGSYDGQIPVWSSF